MKRLIIASLVLGCAAALGCAAGEEELDDELPAFTEHEEPSDFILVEGEGEKNDGLPATFDPNWIMSDSFFIASEGISAQGLQALFEETPYGNRCWLADEIIDGQLASQAIARVAKETGINPLVLLTRMQVEKSLISKSSRPNSQHSIDYAFGCGCPDGRDCMSAYRGLDKQIKCAGETLRKLYDASVDGSGQWRAGKRKKSLDPEWITPGNHATAAFYGYTPWVLRRRGGNWLVWNVTRKFSKAVGEISLPEGCLGGDLRPFIGAPCGCELDCAFRASGAQGFCHPAGFCSLACEGTCPDAQGYASTFCAAVSGDVSPGLCLPKPEASNHSCEALPGAELREADRYVGGSGAAARTAPVCMPAGSGGAPIEPDPEGCLGGHFTPFIGTPCGCPADCDFEDEGVEAVCHPAGFCTLPCEGYCPDMNGHASTFCASTPGDLSPGLCLPQAESINRDCADLANAEPRDVERYVGGSGASMRTREVCMPTVTAPGGASTEACAGDDSFEPNDTLDTAVPLGQAPFNHEGLRVCSGSADHFSVYLPEARVYTISLAFTHRAGDIDLFAYANGEELARSDNTSDGESLRLQGPGTTQLKIVGLGAPNDYSLTVSQ